MVEILVHKVGQELGGRDLRVPEMFIGSLSHPTFSAIFCLNMSLCGLKTNGTEIAARIASEIMRSLYAGSSELQRTGSLSCPANLVA